MAIIGTDKRRQVEDTTVPPWRHVCAIRVIADGGTFVASGALIGPRTVLTSAYVLSSGDAGRVRSIEITPGLNGQTAPFGSVVASPEQIRHDGTGEPRFGAIVLDNDELEAAGWFNVAAAPDQVLMETTLFVGGYPADRAAGRQQCVDSGPARRVDAQILEYEIDTYGGQSGSPVWMTSGGSHVVVGVHSSGGAGFNSGYRITAAVLQTIAGWTDQAATPPRVADIEATLTRLGERLANIEVALQTLIGRLPPARSELDRLLKLELAEALLNVPNIERSAGRNALIVGIPFVTIREVSPRTDIINLLEDIEKVNPPGFLTLIDNAMRGVKGTELATTLQALSGKFQLWIASRKTQTQL
jgi:V8-like Glu-specific endopeptidase